MLPGVDDGADSMEESIEIIKYMEQSGVTDLILTPHYCKRRSYTVSYSDVESVYNDLCKRCLEENIGVRLHLGAELEYSQDGAKYIREQRIHTLAKSKYILVEFAPYADSATILKAVREITHMGYVPVIAHIERYNSLWSDYGTIDNVKSNGAMIQINVRSLSYQSGKIRKLMKYVISKELADFAAGDVHSDPLSPKEMTKFCKFVLKYASQDYLEKIMGENAKSTILKKGE